MKIKFKDNVTLRETSNNLAILYDKEKGILFEMNETASAIARLIKVESDVVKIIKRLTDEFNAEEQLIKTDVISLIEELVELEAIEVIKNI
ncbi:MAG: PqqD family protein [Melioribacteraceae bacterium]